ncbi:hypothetical protein P280DRAFT_87798 [Massarina eburnea CBS 473.64]|uniref:Uncharacterized protein n=1 Tax=Massarina eburnea CBS 473.64 TaxID=1395130 RepID=A0A6A6RUQ2_9PLEO|nr:hypothetical protein P280DRAFT_87798 [Massarina eburnea CBS 473.64]
MVLTATLFGIEVWYRMYPATERARKGMRHVVEGFPRSSARCKRWSYGNAWVAKAESIQRVNITLGGVSQIGFVEWYRGNCRRKCYQLVRPQMPQIDFPSQTAGWAACVPCQRICVMVTLCAGCPSQPLHFMLWGRHLQSRNRVHMHGLPDAAA